MTSTNTAPRAHETIVPKPFNPPVRDMAREWAEDVAEKIANSDDCWGSCKVNEVENESRSGFFPYTNGGYESVIPASLAYAWSSGSVAAPLQKYVDQAVKDAEESWDSENPEHTVAWIYGTDAEQDLGQGALFGPSRERDHWREKFYEFENECLQEGGTFFYKVRVLFFDKDNSRNTTGKPECYFMVGLNTDFEYGRDHISWLSCYGGNPNCTTWPWEKTVPASELTPELIEQMKKDAWEAIRSL